MVENGTLPMANVRRYKLGNRVFVRAMDELAGTGSPREFYLDSPSRRIAVAVVGAVLFLVVIAISGWRGAHYGWKKAVKVERWGWYSIGINVILALLNLVIARASGSLAAQAEVIHNGVDLLTAIAVLVGLKLSTRKSSAFPYGLYKLENVITVFLSMMVFLTAYEVARDAFFSPVEPATVDLWMFAGLTVAIAIPLVFSRYELRAGRATNSPALIADAREYRVHVFTTGVVLASLLSQWFGLPLDRVASLIIVVAITKTGWDLLVDGMRVLLDASLEPETL